MIPYHVHSHYSLQQAFSHIDDLIKRAKDVDIKTLCLTDIHSLSGSAEFIKECKDNNIQPVLGCEFRVDLGDNGVGNICLLARNKDGWLNLIKILGQSHTKDKVLVVSPKVLQEHNDNLICFIGGLNSIVYTQISNGTDYNSTLKHFSKMYEHFFVSIENHGLDIERELNNILESSSYNKLYGNTVYYPTMEDNLYQQIIVCSKYKKTLQADDIEHLKTQQEYTRMFFDTQENYLKPKNDYNSAQLGDLIEDYDIMAQPNIPDYHYKGKLISDPNTFLTNLCRDGWRKKGLGDLDDELKKIYAERIKKELKVFCDTGFSSYMLVIWDIINHARSIGSQVGLRGSAAGCIVSYLTGISDIDPLRPDPTLPYAESRELLFERFINIGRLTKEKFSPPDVDVDFGISHREKMVEYVKEKYTKDCVANIITFGRLDGRGAIKEVFRVLGTVDHEVVNVITSNMIDSGKISDILEDLKEDDPTYNVIRYCIDNDEKIEDFYNEYKREFDIAIKLANTIRTQGKHAAGVVISNSVLKNVIPVIPDPKTGEAIVALEMAHAEYCGAIKYDFLGVAALEKIGIIETLVNEQQKVIMS